MYQPTIKVYQPGIPVIDQLRNVKNGEMETVDLTFDQVKYIFEEVFKESQVPVDNEGYHYNGWTHKRLKTFFDAIKVVDFPIQLTLLSYIRNMNPPKLEDDVALYFLVNDVKGKDLSEGEKITPENIDSFLETLHESRLKKGQMSIAQIEEQIEKQKEKPVEEVKEQIVSLRLR
jgi:hypothetical protein